MNARDLFGKLFVTSRYFTIAIRKRQNGSILENPHFSAEFVVPATRQKWVADPILAEDAENTWLFYEAVDGDHGHIEVAQVMDDCTLGDPVTILQDACHYSYPFVFRHRDTWYMIPESSGAKEVRLYRATEFPVNWELQSLLLREKAVDTTVFCRNGEMYLLTFVPAEGSERVTPRAFRMIWEDADVRLTEIPWENYDPLQVRGAGPIFDMGRKLIRPAQISREQRYGDGVKFYYVDAAEAYREKPAGYLMPSNLKHTGCYVDGLHTYCASSRFEAIDVRCGTVDYGKPLKKLLGRTG